MIWVSYSLGHRLCVYKRFDIWKRKNSSWKRGGDSFRAICVLKHAGNWNYHAAMLRQKISAFERINCSNNFTNCRDRSQVETSGKVWTKIYNDVHISDFLPIKQLFYFNISQLRHQIHDCENQRFCTEIYFYGPSSSSPQCCMLP